MGVHGQYKLSLLAYFFRSFSPILAFINMRNLKATQWASSLITRTPKLYFFMFLRWGICQCTRDGASQAQWHLWFWWGFWRKSIFSMWPRWYHYICSQPITPVMEEGWLAPGLEQLLAYCPWIISILFSRIFGLISSETDISASIWPWKHCIINDTRSDHFNKINSEHIPSEFDLEKQHS